MSLKTEIEPYTLHYKQPVKTSRGSYTDHNIWLVTVYDESDPTKKGIGECAPLHDLSPDYSENYIEKVSFFCRQLEDTGVLDVESLRDYPSILFGLETAMFNLKQKFETIYDTPFARGEKGIQINGLIWMGSYDYMYNQIKSKLDAGFRCIKLKIGAINFDDEFKLLSDIRKAFPANQITLRVDANGAFSPEDAMDKLRVLSQLDIHSIEQPIKAGQYAEMSQLIKDTPLPIALDEELIGVNEYKEKVELLQRLKPQYIILKPTLHGGISGCNEWISIADRLNIGWWITSALESNIGLESIARWCSTFNTTIPQGLGTGGLYTNNFESPLFIKGDDLWYDVRK